MPKHSSLPAVVAVLVLTTGGPAAATDAFTAPYSGDSAGWSCYRDEGRPGEWTCEGSAEASATDGTLNAASEVTVPPASQAQGYSTAVAQVHQDLFRAKPASVATFTIDYQVDAATSESPPDAAGGNQQGVVWLEIHAESRWCQCSNISSRQVAVSDGEHAQPQTFSGPMSASLQLFAPQGTTIRGDIRVATGLVTRADTWCCLLGTVLEVPRGARAEASFVVKKIAATFA
jgi:hypothetical protein